LPEAFVTPSAARLRRWETLKTPFIVPGLFM
jgi:hypothetical protein